MLSWSKCYSTLVGDSEALMGLMVCAWCAAMESGDTALGQNLLCNTLTPAGVCQHLDAAAVKVPDDVAPLFTLYSLLG